MVSKLLLLSLLLAIYRSIGAIQLIKAVFTFVINYSET